MKSKNTIKYLIAIIFVLFSIAYLSVPIYEYYCAATGYGGYIASESKGGNMLNTTYKSIKLALCTHSNRDLPEVIFVPDFDELVLPIGQPTLLFFHMLVGETPDREPLQVMATFSFFPQELSPYIMKIQCFCFNSLMLYPNSYISLPVLLYIDPSITSQDLFFSPYFSLNYSIIPI